MNGVSVTLAAESVAVGFVVARGCTTQPAPPGLTDALTAAIDEAQRRTGEASITQPVRDMLRFGRYKPTGRGKPASEYLLKAARSDKFPRINNLVDLNNLVSLRSLLPISLIDIVRAEDDAFVVRRGQPDEAFVFNGAGQEIGLEDLLLVARASDDRPCANPVKDSMATKLNDGSSDVMAVLYSPPTMAAHLQVATAQFATGLTEWGGATSVETAFLPVSDAYVAID